VARTRRMAASSVAENEAETAYRLLPVRDLKIKRQKYSPWKSRAEARPAEVLLVEERHAD
jgi:hypothetical protein